MFLWVLLNQTFSFVIPVEYVVEYNYDAVHDDELTIRAGEIIRNVRKLEEEGWLEGELNGKRGMFPDNFVKVSICSSLKMLDNFNYYIYIGGSLA